jgi:signal transduction histidine kinase/DNA-binding NarL/FixJ family response regulator
MSADNARFLHSGGLMGERMRAFDWTQTPLGPPETWPQSLRTIVRMMLDSRFAMWMAWGPEYTFFCNDAYLPTLGIKGSHALGARSNELWAEIWHDVGPMIDKVLETGEANWHEGLLLFLERSGYPEETYHTFSYSPVYDDLNRVAGMLCVVTETTDQVIGERRLKLLHDLSAVPLTDAPSVQAAARDLVYGLESGARDAPFALLYLLDGPAGPARQVASTHGTLAQAAPESLALGDAQSPWAVAAAIASGQEQVIENFDARCARVAGPWGEPVRNALVVPLIASGQRNLGALVLGASARRALDDKYRAFLSLLAAQVASGLTDTEARLEERRRAEALAELDRAKNAFFSNVSHEFRTPLTLMLGPIEELMGKPYLPDEDRQALELLRRNGLRMRKLVNSLLDFSRIEAGRIQANFRPTDLSAATADLASVFRAAVEGAGLRLTVETPALPAPVYVDRDMWEKIVLNLLSNAFKHTFEGEIAVRLGVSGEAAQLEVRDTGIGIEAAEIPRLFDRFHRVAGARSRSQEGTGIGLALVKELVRMHGGTIDVQSTPGSGSRFAVTLPLGRAHLPPASIDTGVESGTSLEAGSYVDDALRAGSTAQPATEPLLPLPAQADGGVPMRRARILVADDNGDMRSYLERLLSPFWEVLAAGDGVQALELARAQQPDLLLTDVMMPRLDGFGLIAQIRADARLAATPVIVLSAQAGEEARVQGLSRGADDYLVKPFSSRELIARIEVQLIRARMQSAQEALDRRLADVFRDAPVAACVMAGQDHVFQYANHNFRTLAAGEMLGRPIREVMPDIESQGLLAILDEVRATGQPYFGQSVPITLPHADTGLPLTRYWDFVYQPLRDADGRVDGIAVVGSDITEMVTARKRAESANRAKDEFIAMLGHELRNPLAPIVTTLELMRIRGGEHFQRERGIIERQVQHMSRLVDDLLDVSRIARGTIELKKSVVEIESVVEKAVETAKPLMERRRQTISINVPWHGLEVNVDPVRATQIIANLLTNAVKFSPPEAVITLSAQRRNGDVVVMVRDEGIGMTHEDIAMVFDIFVQGTGQEIDRPQGGLGLGLTIAKNLAELHGGSLTAQSEGPGRGSTFILRLPASLGAPQEAPDTGGWDAVQGGGRRILVVDDNIDAAETLEQLLQMWGFETVLAHDGLAALEVLENSGANGGGGQGGGQFDIALVDIGLPKLDGYGVAQRVKANARLARMRLIALTGYGQESDQERSREVGFDAHLVKPVDLERLAAMLR